MSASPAPTVSPAWNDFPVATFAGQHDTHIQTGEFYTTVPLASLFALQPQAKSKMAGNAFLPSSYHLFDARSHEAQRERGSFVALVGDIDKGDFSAEMIQDAAERFTDGAAWLIYSSAHSRDGDHRWRIIVPLCKPVPFADWYDAQTAFFTYMEGVGIPMDRAMSRAAQPVYLPNVPASYKDGTPLRDQAGEPIYYQTESTDTDAPGLDIMRGIVAGGIASIRQQRATDDREREVLRKAAAERFANRPQTDGGSVMDRFNESTSVATMLELCGYEQSPRSGDDWRSPQQTGETYATRIIENKWVSLSASDAASGLGSKCRSGCFGDAYDLYVHYKHAGNHQSAYRELGREQRGHNVVQGNFRGEAGDQGWQGMPESAPLEAYEEDARRLQDQPDDRVVSQSQAAVPVKVSATPYQFVDPQSIPPRDWLYGRLLLRGQAHGKVAPGGFGKTFHTVGTALSLVTGRPLLGQKVWGGPKRVWIWNLEDPLEELQRAIQAGCLYWGITAEDIGGRLFVDCAMEGAALKIATSTASNGLVMNTPLVDELVRELRERQIDYLDVDPFVSSHGVDENDNVQIDAVTKQWSRVAKLSGTAIGITHHIKKLGAAGEVTAEMARGAVSFVAALRSCLVINRMPSDSAKLWSIDPKQARRYIRIYDDKSNRAPPAEESDWFYLESVDLGNGPADGSRPSDNIAALIPWSPPDTFDGITTDHLRAAQHAIAGGKWREDSQAVAWVGHAVGPIIGRQSGQGKEFTADRAIIRKIVAVWVQNGALRTQSGPDDKGVDRAWIVVGDVVQ